MNLHPARGASAWGPGPSAASSSAPANSGLAHGAVPSGAPVLPVSPAPAGVPSFASAHAAPALQPSSPMPAPRTARILTDASEGPAAARPPKRRREEADEGEPATPAAALDRALREQTGATPLYDLLLAQVRAARTLPQADRPALLVSLLHVLVRRVSPDELSYATVCLGRAFRNDAAAHRPKRPDGKSAQAAAAAGHGIAWVRQALEEAARTHGAPARNQILWGRAILHFTMNVFLHRYRLDTAGATSAGAGPQGGSEALYDAAGLRLLERVLALPRVVSDTRVPSHLANIADFRHISSPADRWEAAWLVCRSASHWVPATADFVRDSLQARIAALAASEPWPQALVEAANQALIRIFHDGLFRLGLPKPPERHMPVEALAPLRAFLQDARLRIAPGVQQQAAPPGPAAPSKAGALADTGPQAVALPNPFERTLDFLAQVASILDGVVPADMEASEPPANQPQ